jgi:hypothetical protein
MTVKRPPGVAVATRKRPHHTERISEVVGMPHVCPEARLEHPAAVLRSTPETVKLGVARRLEQESDNSHGRSALL